MSSSSIEQSYKEMARDVFDAEVNQLTTAEPINKWAAEKTRDKITHVVDQIGPHTNILIANAIYFKVRTCIRLIFMLTSLPRVLGVPYFIKAPMKSGRSMSQKRSPLQ